MRVAVRAAAFGAGGLASREGASPRRILHLIDWSGRFLNHRSGGGRARPAPDQLAGPAEALGLEEAGGKAVPVACGKASVDELVVVRRRGAAEREGHGTEAQLEQAVAARRLGVVVAFRRRRAEDLDLARIEPEALVDALGLRLQRPVVGQEDARRAALDQGRRDGRALDVGERLGGEHHGHVLLAQGLQPLADAGREQRVVEERPGLVEDQERRPAVEARLQPVEQVGKHRRDERLVRHQLFHLDVQHVGLGELLGGSIEETAIGTFQRVGGESRHQRVRLDEDGEAREGALLPGGGRQALQRRPDRVLHVGRDPARPRS